jgi:hypothetical protein
MSFSERDILNEVSLILRGQLDPVRNSGPIDNRASHSQMMEIAGTTFLLNQDSIFHVARLAANRLLTLVNNEIELIEDMLVAIQYVGRSEKPARDSSSLNNSYTALLALDASTTVKDRPELNRFSKNTLKFAEGFRDTVTKNGEIVMTGEEAKSAVASNLASLKTVHTRILAALTNISELLTKYDSVDVPTRVASSAFSNIRTGNRNMLQLLESGTDQDVEQKSKSMLLKSLVSKAMVSLVADAKVPSELKYRGPGNPFPGDVYAGRAAGSGTAASMLTLSGPWILPLDSDLDIAVDGAAAVSIPLGGLEGATLYGRNVEDFDATADDNKLYISVDDTLYQGVITSNAPDFANCTDSRVVLVMDGSDNLGYKHLGVPIQFAGFADSATDVYPRVVTDFGTLGNVSTHTWNASARRVTATAWGAGRTNFVAGDVGRYLKDSLTARYEILEFEDANNVIVGGSGVPTGALELKGGDGTDADIEFSPSLSYEIRRSRSQFRLDGVGTAGTADAFTGYLLVPSGGSIVPSSVVVRKNGSGYGLGAPVATDDGAGNIVGAGLGGVVNYVTGAILVVETGTDVFTAGDVADVDAIYENPDRQGLPVYVGPAVKSAYITVGSRTAAQVAADLAANSNAGTGNTYGALAPFVDSKVSPLDPTKVALSARTKAAPFLRVVDSYYKVNATTPEAAVTEQQSAHAMLGLSVGEQDSGILLQPEELAAYIAESLTTVGTEVEETDLLEGTLSTVIRTSTVQDSSADFVTDGVVAGHQVEILDGVAAAGIYRVDSVAATVLTLRDVTFGGREDGLRYRVFAEQVKISSKSTEAGSSIAAEVTPTELGLPTDTQFGTLPQFEAVNSRGALLSFDGVLEGDYLSVGGDVVEISAVASTLLSLASPISSDVEDAQFSITSRGYQAYDELKTGLDDLSSSKSLLGAYGFDESLDQLDAALSPMLAAGRGLSAPKSRATAMLAHLLSVMTSSPRRSSEYPTSIPTADSNIEDSLGAYDAPAVDSVNRMIDGFQQRNYGRAVDLLVDGDVEGFFSTDEETASYGGAFMKASREALGTFDPVPNTFIGVGESVDVPLQEYEGEDIEEEIEEDDGWADWESPEEDEGNA